jgi:hypothetical protein
MQFNNIIISTFKSGYASQTLNFSIIPCTPLDLTATATSSNQETGSLTNLTLKFNHNLNSVKLKIILPTIGWDYTIAALNSSAGLLNNTIIELNSTLATSILLYNLTNKPDISPVTDFFTLVGLDTLGNQV